MEMMFDNLKKKVITLDDLFSPSYANAMKSVPFIASLRNSGIEFEIMKMESRRLMNKVSKRAEAAKVSQVGVSFQMLPL
jgi:hypothetical protein